MKTLEPSATVAIHSIAVEKKRLGEYVHNFSAGDPFLEQHPVILNSASEALSKRYCGYPPVSGLMELRSLAADWVNATCSATYTADHILVTTGGKCALFLILHLFIEDQDEVLIPAPFWVSYPEMVRIARGVPKIVLSSEKEGWKLTPELLLKNITQRSKILILNNACNPTGILYTKEELAEILAIAKEHQLMVISDEVYSGITYDQKTFVSCGSFKHHADHVILVQSCSKNFGMTGWRVGFAIAPPPIIKTLSALQGQSTTAACLISQHAAIGALKHHHEVTSYVRQAMNHRRDLFIHTFNELFGSSIPMPPSGLYAFISLSSMGVKENDSLAFCEKMLRLHNISLVPGIAFGVEGYVRFAFSELDEVLLKGLHALKHAIGEPS